MSLLKPHSSSLQGAWDLAQKRAVQVLELEAENRRLIEQYEVALEASRLYREEIAGLREQYEGAQSRNYALEQKVYELKEQLGALRSLTPTVISYALAGPTTDAAAKNRDRACHQLWDLLDPPGSFPASEPHDG